MGTFEADMAATEARIDVQEARLLGLPETTQVVPVEELRNRIPFEDLRASDAKQERMNAGEAYHHEFRLLMPDGSVRWLSGHADIRANRIFGVNFDFTRRKLAEEALAQSEARLRTATNAAALGVFEWDPVADETFWGNDRIHKIFGRTLADGPLSRAQFVADYLHPSDRAEFDTAVEKAIQARGRLHVTCRIKRRRGGQRWLQIEAKYETATNERPARFVGVVANITTAPEGATISTGASAASAKRTTATRPGMSVTTRMQPNSAYSNYAAATLGKVAVKFSRSAPGAERPFAVTQRFRPLSKALQRYQQPATLGTCLWAPGNLRTSSALLGIEGIAQPIPQDVEGQHGEKDRQARPDRHPRRIREETLGGIQH
jgi:PAS domain-containing protein